MLKKTKTTKLRNLLIEEIMRQTKGKADLKPIIKLLDEIITINT